MTDPLYLSNKGCPRKYIGGQRCQYCRCVEGRCWYEDSVARQKRGEPILDGIDYAAKPGERTEFDATREALEASRHKRTADEARRRGE